ncbi:ergothioneine biosynthesis protein EgtB [Qipengyuania sp. MTN3-11]|uniref:ergothioneine biosynthesis protein EgtB n=1 Tax=Qipengyuania sp. MTN3-11 TaxID=3056557 RepID=UPI0036F24014
MTRAQEQSPEPASAEGADEALEARFRATRSLSEALVEPLSDADATIQSMEDASPAKWHLAHTSWFWETFLLREHLPGYELFDGRWPFIHNSYYETEGERIARFSRGMLSRPSLEDLLAYRDHVNRAMESLLNDPRHAAMIAPLVALGVAHEQQHQELLLTDIKHALFQNPLGPAMWEAPAHATESAGQGWHTHPGGIARVGHQADGFAFDNEGPAHRVLLEPFALAKRLVTNGEWSEFIADGGYETATLWLSDGWAWINENRVAAPLYWRDAEHFTHAGWQERAAEAPVTHISYFEADAFATWAGHRLPTEFEWEAIARGQEGERAAHDPAAGNQLDDAAPPLPRGGDSLFGDCWQFTRSGYLPYPRFQPAPGAVGEYNGKFMSGQFVLKGASCATARGHSRASYRNFFYPHQRWQFTGLRLAKDV